MIKHYVKVALRLIKRSFLFSSINILGFVFGMAAAFLIYLWVMNELTFEDYNPDADRIYRAIEVSCEMSGEIKEDPSTLLPLIKVFREEFPQVEEATAIKYAGESSSLETENNRSISGSVVYADSAFFSLFPMPVVEGNPDRIKTEISNVILSEDIARKLFGTASALGQKVSLRGLKEGQMTVVAVVRVPVKSHIQFDILLPSDSWNYGWDNFRESIHVYVKMKPKDAGKMYVTEQQAMSRVLHKFGDKRKLLRFQPIQDIHLKTTFADVRVKNHGSMATIYLFVALAVLIIFMGAFNFMTLTTARASLRYKEVGVRKVTGAKRNTLIAQFLSESLVQAIISLILALALTELSLPFFNRMMGTELSLQLSWSILFYVLFGIIGVGCMACSYPAFYLSAISPLTAFKGGHKTGKKGGLIKGLVCVQFVIAITLIMITSLVFKQLHYIQNKDLGLDKENIVSIFTNLWYNVGGFKQEILKNPNVKSVSMGAPIENYLEDYQSKDGEVASWTNMDGQTDSMSLLSIYADGDFVKAFGLQLLKGELQEADFDKYWKSGSNYSVVINETAWKAMKVADPIGMELSGGSKWKNTMRIVGVVKDFNFQSLREKIKPACLIYNPEAISYMHIKIASQNKKETLKFLQLKFEEMAPMFIKEFNYQFFSGALNKNYEKERQQSHTLLVFTVLAIIIAMMGVFGLVALSTEQRTKEIGVRKVNGAHSIRIVQMFCMEYLRWVGVAFVIACPLGYLFMHRWLSEFAYQTSVSWWLFPLSGLVVVGITLLTVIGQTWRKASQNPVKSLRYE